MVNIDIDRALAGERFLILDNARALLGVVKTILSEPPFSDIHLEPKDARLAVTINGQMFTYDRPNGQGWLAQSIPRPAMPGRFDIILVLPRVAVLSTLASLHITPVQNDTTQQVRAECIDPAFSEHLHVLLTTLDAFYNGPSQTVAQIAKPAPKKRREPSEMTARHRMAYAYMLEHKCSQHKAFIEAWLPDYQETMGKPVRIIDQGPLEMSFRAAVYRLEKKQIKT
jgi:hypothetical protein